MLKKKEAHQKNCQGFRLPKQSIFKRNHPIKMKIFKNRSIATSDFEGNNIEVHS